MTKDQIVFSLLLTTVLGIGVEEGAAFRARQDAAEVVAARRDAAEVVAARRAVAVFYEVLHECEDSLLTLSPPAMVGPDGTSAQP
jgi:hypothetical protein